MTALILCSGPRKYEERVSRLHEEKHHKTDLGNKATNLSPPPQIESI